MPKPRSEDDTAVLFVRGMPRDLPAKLKGAAALQQKTLGEYIQEMCVDPLLSKIAFQGIGSWTAYDQTPGPYGIPGGPNGLRKPRIHAFRDSCVLCGSSVGILDSICTARRPRFTTRISHLGFQWVTGKKTLVKSCLGQQ